MEKEGFRTLPKWVGGNAKPLKSCSYHQNPISAADEVSERETEMDSSEEEEEGGEEEAGREEEEEYDEDIGEGEFTSTFDIEMNPLDFMDDENLEIQPYKQDDLPDYETLAVKKRKALLDQGTEVPSKRLREENEYGATMEKMMEIMNYGRRRRRKSKKLKQKGRRKGSKKKLPPEITRKIGEATLHCSAGRYADAIALSNEVILIAPHLPEPFHTLGQVYEALGEDKKAFNCYMFAAKLSPRGFALWDKLVMWSLEQGNNDLAMYCLKKAVAANPEDLKLRESCVELYMEAGNYKKAAESYDEIIKLCPQNAEPYIKAAKLHMACGEVERSIGMLEDYMKACGNEYDLSVVDILASICMDNNEHYRALKYITQVQDELPLNLTVKAGICHVYLGNMDEAEATFKVIETEKSNDYFNFITQVADSYMNLSQYESALKYWLKLLENAGHDNGNLHVKIAQCYSGLNQREQAIQFFRKALSIHPNNVYARLSYASLLVEDDKNDEAISMLSPPSNLDSTVETCSDQLKQWWLNGKVKLTLSSIYQSKGMDKEFVDTIFPLIQETFAIETINRRIRRRKGIRNSVLQERVKVLHNAQQTDNVFQARPIGKTSELVKASRAKRLLQKREILKEEKKAAILAAGLDWQSDDSDDEFPLEAQKEPPLPNLLKDAKNVQLIIELSKALESLKMYWEALEIVSLTLRLGKRILPVETKKELKCLGAQIDSNITDSGHGYEYLRHIIQQRPYSIAAWNCYYKATARSDSLCSTNMKFLRSMRNQYKDCIPPIIISGHQHTVDSRHQLAATYYLHAYKLLPESPLINICAGTSLINLALNFRLVNKHICVAQGLAFLYNNLRNCRNSREEALYNIARAYHHVGLLTLAASHYEKVLSSTNSPSMGYSCLRREAAYNLHLIYKKSGAIDLARQVLKDHCTF